ncbi:MAG: UrcA family protein [Hyphomonadaceae bacterium JAD_PAG50586_4]|nr:MAG: UrcA family protein [Hyphomonadaceae bacterium JAD_PAG50586_4]
MGKEICVAVLALAYFGLSAGESFALPAPQEEAPFRFVYTEADVSTAIARRALDTRLRREAADFCRTSVGGSPVLLMGCRSAVVSAARAQLRLRIGD